jgi:chromosome partitioning protein
MQHVVFNQKGGVGKSTITCNLAAISAWQGMRTLVIDLDSQGNSTRYLLGSDMPDEMPNVAEFFEQSLKFTIRDKSASEYIVHTQWEGLDVIPSSPLLDELHGKLESRHKIYKLRDALELLAEDYDQIYIDTPPALNFYTRSALIAAQGCRFRLTATTSRAAPSTPCWKTCRKSSPTTTPTSRWKASSSTSFSPAPTCPSAWCRS